jgi:hypothetical protein
MSKRLRRLARIGLMGLAVLLLLRIGYGLSWNQTEETENTPGGGAKPTAATSAASPAQPTERVVISIGRALGSNWKLIVTTRGGKLCAELFSSVGANNTTRSSCGHDGRSLEVVQNSAGSARRFLFGPLPTKAERVWMTLQGGQIIDGNVFAVPRYVGAPFSLYLLVVKNVSPREVVAVDAGHAGRPRSHSTSAESERRSAGPTRPATSSATYLAR